MAIVGDEERKNFHQTYDHIEQILSRCFWGSVHNFWHWTAGWWKLNSKLGLAQFAYLLSLILIFVCTAFGALDKAPKSYRPWPSTLPSDVTQWAGFGFTVSQNVAMAISPYILPICVLIGLIYKTLTGSAGQEHEGQRRQTVATLLRWIRPGTDLSKLGGVSEARVKEICECIHLDIQEFLQLRAKDVEILLLRYHPPVGIGGEPELSEMGREFAKHGGFFSPEKRRSARECVPYEAVRLGETIIFHDLKSRHFRKFFGDIKTDYRTLVCIPVSTGDTSEIYAVLTLKLLPPYLLWPKKKGKLERRLAMYTETVNLFGRGDI